MHNVNASFLGRWPCLSLREDSTFLRSPPVTLSDINISTGTNARKSLYFDLRSPEHNTFYFSYGVPGSNAESDVVVRIPREF